MEKRTKLKNLLCFKLTYLTTKSCALKVCIRRKGWGFITFPNKINNFIISTMHAKNQAQEHDQQCEGMMKQLKKKEQ
jgi:hypothetical protein